MTQTLPDTSAAATNPAGAHRRYPAYRDSGIAWLGDIPAHWEVKPLYSRYATVLGKMLNNEMIKGTSLFPYLRNINVQWDRVDVTQLKEMDFTAEEREKYRLEMGDLLVCEGGEVGRTAIWRGEVENCYIQNAVHRLRPMSELDEGRFLFYLLFVVAFQGVFVAEGNRSTIVHLTSEKLRRRRFPFPPLEEQRAIAAYLDRETARIDALVGKKQRLIELLREKRAALISHAVTRGLDANAPLKDSGVPWLGQIPAQWQLRRIKYLLHEIVDTEHKTAPIYPDGEYLVVRTSNVRNGKLVLEDASYTDYEGFVEWTQRGKPVPGDILFTREAPTGEACLVPSDLPLCLGQRLVLFRMDHTKLDGRFGVWSLYGGIARQFIDLLSQGTTVVHFNMGDIGNIPLLTPPFEEQLAIASYLDRETAKLDALVSAIERQIEKLKEYRAAVIAAAVTGKIDVRGEGT